MTEEANVIAVTPARPNDHSVSDDEQDFSRITVLVGCTLIDVGLPAHVSISAMICDVIELANDQLRVRGDSDTVFDATEDKWTLAWATGGAIQSERSLSDAGVCDGDLLLVQQIQAPTSSSLVDDLRDPQGAVGEGVRSFGEQSWAVGWLALTVVVAAVTALWLPELGKEPSVAGFPITALAVLAAGVGCSVTACVSALRSRDSRTSSWLAGVGLPLIFGGLLHIMPKSVLTETLPVALAVTALIALVQMSITERGRAAYTAVIAIAAVGVLASVAELFMNPQPRTVGALVAAVAVVFVYLAPRVTITLSGLPIPRVPTAGEPLDDIETHGGTTVEGVNAVGKQVIPTEEGLTKRVIRASERLAGFVTAAAVLAAIGCYLALDVSAGFYWQGTAFAIAVAVVLCLRGRTHHDLAQATALIGSGMAIVLAVIVKTATFVPEWQTNAAAALVAVMVLLVACGFVAPARDFSPVLRRWAEIGEYVAVGLVFPLACWIIRLYAFFRELRIG